MKYPRYQAYKDIGIEWIGEIPEHWCMSKVRYIASYLNGFAFKPEDWHGTGIPIIRIQNLTDLEADFNFTTMDVPKQYLVKNGDILLSWSASLGVFLWERDFDAWLNQHIFKVNIRKDIVTRSFFLWLATWFIGNLKEDAHGSTMQHLIWDKFASFKIVLPPIEEQLFLGSFLNLEIEKVDFIIYKQQRLIELLKEIRQAIITNAVTKGLDPNVPMKDSGVEWIGEIPEHWDVKRLKFVSKIQFSNVDKHSFDSEMPVLLANYTDVYKNQFITTEMEFMEATASLNEIKKFHLEAGDILVTKDSETPDDIAIPALVKSTLPNLLCGYHLAMLRPNSHSLDSNYLFYLYSDKKFRGKYESEANGITRFGLSQESFSDTFICIPDISEQRTISLFLEEQTSKIDYLISKQLEMIELAKEYKEALISQAVTGKIDVRGFTLPTTSSDA